ncbi:MAG: hypothetical protein IJX21_06275 [Alistipes sp.]|nr:hypothetical protein [Alistipes sp.]
MQKPNVGIVGLGLYLPQKKMTAAEISAATGGNWSEDAVINKLGIVEKYVPSSDPCDGSQEMGALAALDCLKNTGVDPLEIDAILCITEEWKEYPLTTSACYVQDRIGAKNAWGIDVQNRCCTCVSAMKLAKDMLIADDEINTVLVCGGYRNCDLIDYTDNGVSFMFNLAAGGGAVLLKKNYNRNLLLGTGLMTDGSVATAMEYSTVLSIVGLVALVFAVWYFYWSYQAFAAATNLRNGRGVGVFAVSFVLCYLLSGFVLIYV